MGVLDTTRKGGEMVDDNLIPAVKIKNLPNRKGSRCFKTPEIEKLVVGMGSKTASLRLKVLNKYKTFILR